MRICSKCHAHARSEQCTCCGPCRHLATLQLELARPHPYPSLTPNPCPNPTHTHRHLATLRLELARQLQVLELALADRRGPPGTKAGEVAFPKVRPG